MPELTVPAAQNCHLDVVHSSPWTLTSDLEIFNEFPPRRRHVHCTAVVCANCTCSVCICVSPTHQIIAQASVVCTDVDCDPRCSRLLSIHGQKWFRSTLFTAMTCADNHQTNPPLIAALRTHVTSPRGPQPSPSCLTLSYPLQNNDRFRPTISFFVIHTLPGLLGRHIRRIHR